MSRRTMTLCVLFALLLVAGAGCGSDSVGPADEAPGPLAEAILGSEGGVLAADGIELAVPPGAFGEPVSLALYEEQGDPPFGEHQADRWYRVAGLPEAWSSPLVLRLRRVDQPGSPALALGEEARVPSENASRVVWRIVPATVDTAWCACELPASDPAGGRSRSSRQWDREARVAYLFDHGIYLTARFELRFPAGAAPQAQVIAASATLETAYAAWETKGFSASGRTVWPVEVTLRPMAAQTSGYFVASKAGADACYLELNTLLLANPEEMRVTAGHELLHFFQYFYDPRGAWDKATTGGQLLWLDEATATWGENLFAASPQYVPTVRDNNELRALEGAAVGAGGDAANYGYGMSSLIKYAAARHDDGFILQAYQDASQGAAPWPALLGRIPAAVADWWGPFLGELLTASLYPDVTAADVRDERSDMFGVRQPTDTLATFTESYGDLSGRIFLVRLLRQDFHTEELQAALAGGDAQISAFRIRDGAPLELIDRQTSSLTVPGLQDLVRDGWDLALLVSHHRAVAPFTQQTPLTLTLRIVEGLDLGAFDMGIMSLRYAAEWSDGLQPLQYLLITGRNGSVQGNTFFAEWDSTDTSNGMVYKGTLRAVLADGASAVTEWSAENRWIYPMADTYNLYRASGRGLPLAQRTDTSLLYSLDGNAACNSILNIEVVQVSAGEVTRHLVDWDCNADSWARLELVAGR